MMGKSSGNLLAEALRRVFERASDAGLVDFLLIGGNAVIAHGVPRFTRDIVELTMRNNLDPEKDNGFRDLVLKFGNERLLTGLVHEIKIRRRDEPE